MHTTRWQIALAALWLSAGCSKSPSQPTSTSAGQGSTPQTTTPSITSVSISGPIRVALAETVRYTALAHYSDGSTKDVTDQASWSPHHDTPSHLPMNFTSPGVAVGINRGDGSVGAWFADRVANLNVLVLEAGTFRLSGVISETSGRPISAVSVDVVSGTGTGLRAISRPDGTFVLYGVAGNIRLRASLDGFVPVDRELLVTEDGHTEAFAMTPIDAPADISGAWTMSLMPSPGCRPGLPDIAKGRTYQVEFIQQGTGLKVRTSSPTLKVLNPDEDYGTIFGTHVHFFFAGDTDYGDWSSTDLVDRLSPSETLGFDGTVEGTVNGSEIRATLDGDIVYWLEPAPTAWSPAWYCRAHDHVITLRR